jgi:ribosomal protein L14
MKRILYLLLFISQFSFGQTMVDVATGEYSVQWVKSDGTVWAPYASNYDVTYTPTKIAGLSGIVEADGGQYTSVFRGSDGKAYSARGGAITSTAYPVDNTGAPFTCDKIYAMWRMVIAIKNGEVWYWSAEQASPEDMLLQFGTLSTPVSAPRKLIQPVGKTIVKCLFGSNISPYTNAKLWGIASDGTIWQWDQTHTTPFQVTGKPGFPQTWTGKVVDAIIAADVNMVVTSTNEVWCWGYNGTNYGGRSDWQGLPMTNIAPLMTTAGIAFPLKQIIANFVCVQVIDANNNKFGIGNQQSGSLGSGYMSPSFRTNWNGSSSNVYAYDFLPAHGLQSTWMQLPGKWKSLKSNTSFVFYSYGQDMAGNWYSYGRGKGQVLGNGVAWKVADQVIYPDWRDIPAPRLVTPLTTTWIVEAPVNTAANRNPIANAGINQYLNAGVTSTTLYGSGSHQQQPTNVTTITMSNQWTMRSGPNTPTITTPTSQNTTVTGMTGGTYIFRNTVTNSLGVTDYQDVTVVIGTAGNIPPTAKAGNDIVITLPTNSTSLSGSGTDTDGTISSYNWVKISGPAAGTIATPSAANTTLNGLAQGVYQFQLTVTDNNGAIGNDVVQVTVNAAPNQLPTANAGSDIVITLPTNSTTLSGSGTDPDGTISSYGWTKVSGPAAGTIGSASSATTTLNGLVLGVYKYQLKVTDNNGATDTDTVQVTVLNAPSNQLPTAAAGTDIVITLPTNSSTLSGSGTDPDGTISAYDWVKISGPAAGTIVSVSSATTAINNLVQGVYQYQLTVTDNNGATATDIVQVTVLNAPGNLPPTAYAGTDIAITLPTNSTTLGGSGSDPDGTISSYDWVQVSGPAAGTIASASSATTDLNNLVQGVYQFELTVTDNNGATNSDIVQVTVNASSNQLPAANAGSDIVITLPTNSTTLVGSGSDPDGTISSYSWVQVSGPAPGAIASASSATTDLNNLVQGVYQYQLTVTDNNGATSSDIIQITVMGAGNQLPVADAGNDINITLPDNSISLVGHGTDPDGVITAYQWRVINAPGTYTFSDANSQVTELTNLEQGVYEIELSVYDNYLGIGYDTIFVNVGSIGLHAPAEVVNVYPNPVSSLLTVQINSPENGAVVGLELFDIKGSLVYQKKTNISGNTQLETIDMARLNSGTYVLVVNYGYSKQIVKKIIKM